MKKNTKRVISLILSIGILFTTFFSSTMSLFAATPVNLEGNTFDVWADPNGVLSQEKIDSFSSDKLATLGGIKPFKNSANSTSLYYLFLPSNADCTNLTFWFPTGKSMKIGGQTIQSGVPTDALRDINAGGTAKNYTINDGSDHTVVCMKSGDVGSIFVDTVSGSMKNVYGSSDHSKSEAGSIMVVQPDGKVDYMGDMEKIQGRGNATWGTSNEKNPFNVKLAESTSLLGMGKAKKWVLLANASDSSLLKNQITYDFAKYIGVKYQPTCKPVDLYINQQYYGSYQLAEKVEIKSSRIDVVDAYENLEIANGTVDPITGTIIPANLNGTATNSVSSGTTIGNKKYSSSLKNPDDITGGYLYELEMSTRWTEENAGFCGYNKQCWVMKSCDYASTDMVNYSYDLLFALGAAAYNNGVVPSVATTKRYTRATANNPAPAAQYQGKKWNELLDSDSLMRYYWVEEVFKNLDAATSSCYFYKNTDKINSKIYAGPVWDMDKCWGFSGSRWGQNIGSSSGWYAKNVRIYAYNGTLFGETDLYISDSSDSARPLALVGQLMTLSDAWKDAGRYWYAYVSPAIEILKGNAVDEKGTLRSIQDYYNTIYKSAKMNAARFSAANSTNGSYQSYDTELKNWVTERQTWINNQFSKTDINNNTTVSTIPAETYTGKPITPEFTVTTKLNNVDTVLEEGVDYTVEYVDNVNVGTAIVKINGAGIFTGTISKAFTIEAANISGCTATIDQFNYIDNDLVAKFSDENGKTFDNGVNYQWYRDGEAISGANEKNYTITADDVGKKLTVTISGDNNNIKGSITSNECEVREGERPTGFTKTIASWNYDFTVNEAELDNADLTGETRYYLATSGENKDTSKLIGSVDAVNDAKIKWSGTGEYYVNGEVTNQAPVMGTSKTDLRAWGEFPYFETVVSTAGYENIGFSAKLGGSKKGPRDWKLQYSTDGTVYKDIDNTTYSITENKVLEQAFDNVVLPIECNDQNELHIRMVCCNDIAINGVNALVGQLSGDAAVNDVTITGASIGIVTSLNAPTFDVEDGSKVYNDTAITITDNNGGADVYYTVDGEEVQYTGAIKLFDNTSKIGDTVTVSAVSRFEDIESAVATATYTFAGIDVVNFSYTTYSTEVSNGAVQSVGGVYGKSGKMTAYTDGKSQYVPLWRDDRGSFCIAPDDGALWSAESGFTYNVATAGYENTVITFDAFTTNQGPKSITVQYKNGESYEDIETFDLTLEKTTYSVVLPTVCDNNGDINVRVISKEDSTFLGEKLHKNNSKGNLYVNNVVFSGEDNGDNKMPYTNKATSYFGLNGTIKYNSPDGMDVHFAVFDSTNEVVMVGIVPAEGIQLSKAEGFDALKSEPYKVLTWVGDIEDNRSAVNTKTYRYKGSTITKFDFTSTKRPISNYYTDFTQTEAKNTSGANAGTISMYPNGVDKTTLTYSDAYGIKVSWSEANKFIATKNLDKPAGNGFWLIKLSTLGFKNITLNLNQVSSNKGPRDWGVAYSTDGETYKYIANSNVRAISNDATLEPAETVSNLALPEVCENKEEVFVKVFINGGESVDGDELELLLKGNTGMNGIEFSGIEVEHIQGELVSTVEATCSEEGYTVYKCAGCGAEYKTNLTEINPDNHNYQISSVVDATCRTKGYTVYKCNGCGDEYHDDIIEIDPENHDYEIVDEVVSNCTTIGHTTYKCKECENEYTAYDEAVNPENHSGKLVWISDANGHKKAWNCCNAVEVEETEHSFVDEPICSECGYVCQHEGGEATCINQAVCDICKQPYGMYNRTNHEMTAVWESNDDTCRRYYPCCNTDDIAEGPHSFVLESFKDGIASGKCECGKTNSVAFADYYNTAVDEVNYILDYTGDGFINAKDYAKLTHKK